MSQVTEDPKIQAGNNDDHKKVVFSPEQQERVNELIKEAMGRAGREHRETAETAGKALKEATERLSSLEQELATLRSAHKEGKGKGNDEDFKAEVERIKAAHADEVRRLSELAKQHEGAAKSASENLMSMKKSLAIQAAASKINFVDLNAAVKLTQESIKWDDTRGKFIVVNENGTERMNSSFEVMSLDEFYTEFASQNPYLVRGEVKSGTGSTESVRTGISSNGKYAVEDIFGPKSTAALAAKLKKENPSEYHRLKGIAKENNLI